MSVSELLLFKAFLWLSVTVEFFILYIALFGDVAYFLYVGFVYVFRMLVSISLPGVGARFRELRFRLVGLLLCSG